jgi:hypothetical protein
VKLKDILETVEIVSTHSEGPDLPYDVVVRIDNKKYKYKDVGYDDLERFRFMLRKGLGFKALNKFKEKKYDYELL